MDCPILLRYAHFDLCFDQLSSRSSRFDVDQSLSISFGEEEVPLTFRDIETGNRPTFGPEGSAVELPDIVESGGGNVVGINDNEPRFGHTLLVFDAH